MKYVIPDVVGILPKKYELIAMPLSELMTVKQTIDYVFKFRTAEVDGFYHHEFQRLTKK